MKLHQLRPGRVYWQLVEIRSGVSNRVTREVKRRIRVHSVSLLDGVCEASIDAERPRRYAASDVAKWVEYEPFPRGWHSVESRRERKGQRSLCVA